MIVGVVVVAATAVMAKIFLFGNKKKKAPITLKDATIKYPLKLVDREVWAFSLTLSAPLLRKLDALEQH